MKIKKCIICAVLIGFFVSFFTVQPALAQEDGQDLAKSAQNPVGDLISLPFQNRTIFNVGPEKDPMNILNIQPVIPVHAGPFNLINRTIIPIIHQPAMVKGQSTKSGIGDINHTLFMSPADPGDIIWGVGPIVSFNTATDKRLGSGKFSLGPSAVVLTMPGNWVVGLLASNIWSIAGDVNRDPVNSFLFQYFINYNLPQGWYLTSSPIITANWEADQGERWTVPVGGGFGKLFKIGPLPINFQSQAHYYLDKPKNSGDWELRFQLQFLFPK